MKKITRATVKKFIRENKENLYIKNVSAFSGMTDGTEYEKNPKYVKAVITDKNTDYNLGVEGAWFVGSSRDYLQEVKEDGFTGIEVYNACGTFVLAVKK